MATSKVKIFIGSHGSGKSDSIYSHFISLCKKNDGSFDFAKKIYLVVPEQDTNAKQRLIMEKAKENGNGILNIDVISFDRMAHNVFEKLNIEPINENIIGDDAKTMLLSLLISKLSKGKDNRLVYYKKMQNKYGFAKKLMQVVSEFYAYDINDEKIDKVISSVSDSLIKDKLNDLKIIFNEFKKSLDEKQFSIKENKYDLLDKKVLDVDIFDGAYVAFDGFTGFTPVELSIFNKVASRAFETIVTIDMRYDDKVLNKMPEQSDLFYLSEKFLFDIKKYNDIEIIDFDKKRDGFVNKYESLEKYDLYKLSKNIYAYNKNDSENIDVQNILLYKAENVDAEIRNVIENIFELVNNNDYKYSDIKIVVPDIGEYGDKLLTEFNKYNIPLFIDMEYSILNSPYIETIRSAVSVVVSDFSYDACFRYINAGLTDKDNDIVYELDNFIRKYGVRGYKWYKDGIEKLINDTKAIGEDNKNKYLSKKREIFNPLISLYENIHKKQTANSFVDKLDMFIKEIDLDNRFIDFIEKLKDNLTEDELFKEQKILQGSIDTVHKTFLNITKINENNDEQITISDFSKMIDIGFSETNVKTIPFLLDQVVVGDIMRSRFDNPKVMFFIGLNQSKVPKTTSDTTIINDKMREQFEKEGITLSQTTEETALNQRFYIYLILTNPLDKLILSYPMTNIDGTSDSKSQVISEIEKIFWDDDKKITKLIENKVDTNNFKFRIVLNILDYIAENVEDLYLDDRDERKLQLMYLYKFLIDKGYNNVLSKYFSARYKNNKKLYEKFTETFINELKDKDGYFKVSDTSIETYNKCPYMYYLKYFLRLNERENYKIAPVNIGNFYHIFFNNFFSCNYMLKGKSDMDVKERFEKVINDMGGISNIDKGLFGHNREKFILDCLKESLFATLKIIRMLNEGSDFDCVETESPLNMEIGGDELKTKLTGKIDKIETYENYDKCYVNIIDYKTGKKEIDTKLIDDGIEIQLLLYLDYCLKNKFDKKKTKDKEISPISCGAYYIWITEPSISIKKISDKDNIESSINKEMSYNGFASYIDKNSSEIQPINVINKNLKIKYDDNNNIKSASLDNGFKLNGKFLNNDERDDLLSNLENKVEETVKNIKKGIIDVKPNKNANPCEFCSYVNICRKDQQIFENGENDINEA